MQFFAVKYYFLYFETLVGNLVIPFKLHLIVNCTTLSKAEGLWFSYTHDLCFLCHNIMYFGTAPTYFPCIMRAFPFRGWEFYSEAMKELWPGCRSHWIVRKLPFLLPYPAFCATPFNVFSEMVTWLSAYLDNRMK